MRSAKPSPTGGGSGAVPASGTAFVVLGLLLAGGPLAGTPAAPAVYADGPPPGHTGGFGEPTCHACHDEFEMNEPGGELLVQGLPDGYRPGSTYVLTVMLREEATTRAGFQAAVRYASGSSVGRQAGHLVPLDGRTTVRADAESGTEYVQHTTEGTDVAVPGLAVWSFEWRAPAAADPVVLHLAGNAANGDNSPFGDLVYQVVRTLEPAP